MKNKLKAIREKAGMTQTQLSQKLKISRPMFSVMENGNAMPTAEQAQILEQELKQPITKIFPNSKITYNFENENNNQNKPAIEQTSQNGTTESKQIKKAKQAMYTAVYALDKIQNNSNSKQSPKPNIWQKLLKKIQKQKGEQNG